MAGVDAGACRASQRNDPARPMSSTTPAFGPAAVHSGAGEQYAFNRLEFHRLGQNRWSELRGDRFDRARSGNAAATVRSISLAGRRLPRVVESVVSLMRLIRVLYTRGCISHHRHVRAKQRQRPQTWLRQLYGL